ncbi:hypothetical protein [Brucella intermedia]|uniref:hypothetical protein n=1 Tax=Brucella intermedia TaxID=94625 RepID=UPI002361BA6D|nr:hypothetical protein [Brucella intermedia]
MKSASEEFRDKLWLDFSVFSYRLAHWTANIFAGIILFVPMAVACILTIVLGGAWLMDIGNHFLGSGTLEVAARVFGIVNMIDAALVEHKGLVLISILAIISVVLTLKSHPLKQMAASVGCIAVHLMLIGALL